MLSRLRNLFSAQAASEAAPVFPDVDPAEIDGFLFTDEGLSRINWEAANAWIEANPARGRPQDLRRAIVGALLTRTAGELSTPHRAWRSPNVEGLSPDREPLVRGLTKVAETSYRVLSRDLAIIRGAGPIPPIAIIAISPLESYVDFIAHYYPDSGEFTSGGVYLRGVRDGGPDTFPTIALPILPNADFANAIAHELTHHALAECNLPLWVEEGFTQMFEERIVGYSAFTLDAEMVAATAPAGPLRRLTSFSRATRSTRPSMTCRSSRTTSRSGSCVPNSHAAPGCSSSSPRRAADRTKRRRRRRCSASRAKTWCGACSRGKGERVVRG
jgi:hypothetical protein